MNAGATKQTHFSKYIKENQKALFGYFALGILIAYTLSFFGLNRYLLLAFSFVAGLPIALGLAYLAISRVPGEELLKYRVNYQLKQPKLHVWDKISITAFPVFLNVIWIVITHNKTYLLTDVLIFLVAVIIFYLFLNYYHDTSIITSQDNPELKFELLIDNPIENLEQDILRRSNFVKTLANLIRQVDTKKGFVFGLYGRWGEGKTSVINLVENELKNDFLIYKFNPWFFNNKEAIIKNFYKGLEETLRSRYYLPKNISTILKDFPPLIIKGILPTPFLSLDFNLDGKENEPEKLKGELESFIRTIDKKILIVVDDIDRLQAKEILTIFGLVVLAAAVDNLVFILSFDPISVKNLLSNKLVNFSEYLDKIVQLGIHIPLADTTEIDSFILYSYPHKTISYIDQLLNSLEISGSERKEFDDKFTATYREELSGKIFLTLRSAKRYLNYVSSTLPLIKKEIYLYDFFILSIFQNFFPEIYMDMRRNKEYYASRWTISFWFRLSQSEDERKQQIKTHIENLLPKDDVLNDVAKNLLKSLFPDVHAALFNYRGGVSDAEYREKKRVAHPDCYNKYFELRVSDWVFGDEFISDTINAFEKMSEVEIISSLKAFQNEGRLTELFQRLKFESGRKRFADSNFALKMVRSLYGLAFDFATGGDIFLNEFDQGVGLLFRIIEDSNLSNAEIQATLEEVITYTSSIELIAYIPLYANSSQKSEGLYKIGQAVNTEKLKEIASIKLKEKLIDSKVNIFSESGSPLWRLVLFQWSTNWTPNGNKNRSLVGAYMSSIFELEPGYIGKFLSRFVKEEFIGTGLVLEFKELLEAYDIKMINELAHRFGEKAYSNEQEKRAIELFRKYYYDWEQEEQKKANQAASSQEL